jgi:hypothetical protein
MRTTIKPYLPGMPASYMDKISSQAAAAWLLTVLVIFVGFRYTGMVISWVLAKLHELFIQKNILKL